MNSVRKNGFPYTAYKQCNTLEEAKEFFSSLGSHKMIIKPLDSNSSRGVYTVTDEKEIDDYFNESLSFSRSINAVLCEEYIEGTEFMVDGIVVNGKHYSLTVSKKKINIDQKQFNKITHNYYDKNFIENLKQVDFHTMDGEKINRIIRAFDFPGYEPAYYFDDKNRKVYLKYTY